MTRHCRQTWDDYVLSLSLVMFSPCSIEKEEKQDEADIEIPTSLFEV